MELGIDGKLALITGSTAGIGFAAARALAEEGARVTVNGRTTARVVQAVDQLKQELPGASVAGIALISPVPPAVPSWCGSFPA